MPDAPQGCASGIRASRPAPPPHVAPTAQDKAGASAPANPDAPRSPGLPRSPRLPRGRSRTPGSAGAGMRATSPAYPSTRPNRPTSPTPRPGRPRLPRLARRHDVLVRAADEVPPHDDLLAERLPAEHEHPRPLGPRLEQRRRRLPCRLHDAELGPRQVAAREGPPTRGRRAPPPRTPRPPGRRRRHPGPARPRRRRAASPPAPATPTPTATRRTPAPAPRRRPGPPRARGARSAARRRPTPTAARATAARRGAASCPGVDTSECEMPRPAVMRLTSPGRTRATVPRESRCSTSPLKSHDTVASPQWGWGATSMPPLSATSSGP